MHPEQLWHEGLARFKRDDFAGAEPWFRQLQSEAPAAVDPDRLSLMLAACCHGQNRLLPALQLLLPLLRARRNDRWFANALMHYGSLCFELGLAQHWLQVSRALAVPFDPSGSLQDQQLVAMRGAARLLVGDLKGGWRDFEARAAVGMSQGLNIPLPRWSDPESGDQPRLLLLADQGFGDLLFSLRFVPLLRQRVATLTLACDPALVALMQATRLFDAVRPHQNLALADLDAWEYLTGLPVVLQVGSAREVPMPPLVIPSEQMPPWCRELRAGPRRRPLVALNWQGGKEAENIYAGGIRERSFPVRELEALAALRHCDLISVQVGAAAPQIYSTDLARQLVPHQASFDGTPHSFLKTAAALQGCDLLITNDTSVAHLGGCLGVPTWVLLKTHPSWHWGDAGEQSIWYDSLRCWRQPKPFDWSSLMKPLDQALGAWLRDWRCRRGIPEFPGP